MNDVHDGLPSAAPKAVAAIVLAAGESRRMGPVNKLLLPLRGRPLIHHVVQAALDSRASHVVVVTGFDREAVSQSLRQLPIKRVHNPTFRDGMGSSLRAGVTALAPALAGVEGKQPALAGVLIVLGDMPQISAAHLDALISELDGAAGPRIVVATRGGRRGNPVLFSYHYFAALRALQGDKGARDLIAQHHAAVRAVEMPDDAVLTDIDTPQAYALLAASGAEPAPS